MAKSALLSGYDISQYKFQMKSLIFWASNLYAQTVDMAQTVSCSSRYVRQSLYHHDIFTYPQIFVKQLISGRATVGVKIKSTKFKFRASLYAR